MITFSFRPRSWVAIWWGGGLSLLLVLSGLRLFLLLTNIADGWRVGVWRMLQILAAGVIEDAIVFSALMLASLLLLAAVTSLFALLGKKLEDIWLTLLFIFHAGVVYGLSLLFFIDVGYYRFAKVHLHLYVIQYISDAQYFYNSIFDIISVWQQGIFFAVTLIFWLAQWWLVRQAAKAAQVGRLRWHIGMALALLVGTLLVNSQISFDQSIEEDVSNNALVYIVSTLDYFECHIPAIEQQLATSAPEQIRDQYIRTTPDRLYIDDAYPAVHASPYVACRLGIELDVCERDQDGDGFVQQDDCNDADAAIFPGARDVPFNGEDENCNGIDDGKPNIILLVLESIGAENLGYINGGQMSVTPHLDTLAADSAAFTNFYSGGTTTAYSVISSLCSQYPVGQKPLHGATGPAMLCLPEILKPYGYTSLEIQSGDLGFLNKYEYFSSVGFDKTLGEQELREENVQGWGITDRELFGHITDELDQITSPFFLMVYNTAAHHPWPYPVDGGEPLLPEENFHDRYLNLLHYTDAALGEWLEENKNKEWLRNSILVITSDNGQPIDGKRVFNYASFLNIYEDNVWVPLLISSPIDVAGRYEQIGSHVDIPPTVLDLLGIDTLTPFRGESLFAKKDDAKALLSSQYGGCSIGLRQGKYKYIQDLRQRFSELYDISQDRDERFNIAPAQPQIQVQLSGGLLEWYLGNVWLHETNRIWSVAHDDLLTQLHSEL